MARRDGATGTGGVFYYFSDHLKTASVITDSAGVIKAESDYYPWGGELQFVNNDSNDYKFTGKKRDIETGLDYFGARYYSNGLGRWVSADWSATPVPVPYADLHDPQSLNLYNYVRGLPTTITDFDGHGWLDNVKKWKDDHPRTMQGLKGAGKIVVGVGLVATIAVGDAPGGAVGVGLVVSGTISAVASAVSGTTDIVGASTNTNVEPAQKALDSVSSVPALLTTVATGNPEAGATVGTITDAVTLAAKPQEALKNAATLADAIKTGVDAGHLAKDTAKSVADAVHGMNPPPPPPPPAPKPPACTGAGGCHN